MLALEFPGSDKLIAMINAAVTGDCQRQTTDCIRNGLLPVTLPGDAIAKMAGQQVTIDLAAQSAGGHRFEIDSEAKAMLLEGLDAIDLTLKHHDAIAAWQASDRLQRPWVYLEPCE